MTVWQTNYKGHEIRVENTLRGEKLFIDNELVTKDSNLLSSELRGQIPSGDGKGEEVVAMLRSGLIGIGCRVVVNGVELFRQTAWSPFRRMW